MMFRFSILLTLFFTLLSCNNKTVVIPENYNIVWDSQSENSSGSMPCGGGDIGLNVWVEKGDILFYISRSGVFDENNTFPKLGRIRVSLDPNPFNGGEFSQELVLDEGFIRIKGSNETGSAEAILWVDVSQPVIHFDLQGDLELAMTVNYESWRYRDRMMKDAEKFQSSYKWAPIDSVYTLKDEISFEDDAVVFYHHNRPETIFDLTVHQQKMDSVKDEMFNPLANMTFGGILKGTGMVPAGNDTSTYLDTDYKSWAIRSGSQTRHQQFRIFLYTDGSGSVDRWRQELKGLVDNYTETEEILFSRSKGWWHNFWDRSFIVINPNNPDPADKAWQVGRNYQLFRYMLGCNASGTYPTKFNGGLFTYDPRFIDPSRNFTPDYRNWCGGVFTAQNQRLVYFPMLKGGDFDMMIPQFDFYKRMLKNAELRSRVYWQHDGACYTEQIENFGLPNCSEYGWNRPEGMDPGLQYNNWLEYQWDTSLEFCWMIILLHQYTGTDISEYLPLIKSCLIFFDEHYRQLTLKRTGLPLDENGHLVLFPGSGCETYKLADNSTSTIAALKTVLQGLLNLEEEYLNSGERDRFAGMLPTIPPISYREFDEKTTISPAKSWERINNTEAPQLYPVYPWRIFGVGRPGLDTAINTYLYDPDVVRFRDHISWKQYNIFAACLGLREDSEKWTIKKMEDSGRRFPAFWGPGNDWTPDHNWGGSGMIGLQEMLIQNVGEKILLFPAWPLDWDVHFKLHAPGNTVVEAMLEGGAITMLHVEPASRKEDIIVSIPDK